MSKRATRRRPSRNRLFLEVDNQTNPEKRHLMEEPDHFRFRERDRQQAVLQQLLKNISAKDGRLSGRKPYSRAPRRCSRELPQPKFLRQQYAAPL